MRKLILGFTAMAILILAGCSNENSDSLDITLHYGAEKTLHERTGRLTATYSAYTFFPNPNYKKYRDIYGNYYDSYYEIPEDYRNWGYYETDTYPGYTSWQTASISDDYAKVTWETDNTDGVDSDTQKYLLSFDAGSSVPYQLAVHKTGSKHYTSYYQTISVSGSLEGNFNISGSVYTGSSSLTSLISTLSRYDDYFRYEIEMIENNPDSYLPYFTSIKFETY